jgi:ribonuclease P/MRP protein subunit RPP1
MVACGSSENYPNDTGFKIFNARYIRGPSQREIRKEVQIALREGSLSLVQAGESSVNRTILTTPGVTTLCDLHLAPKNAFDRVCALNAAEHQVAIDFRVTPLRELRGTPRQRVIRLYEEILHLQNRYEFPITISSGAVFPGNFRSPRATEALLSEVGMDRDLIHEGYKAIQNLSHKSEPVRVV